MKARSLFRPILLAIFLYSSTCAAVDFDLADRVVINKGERKLLLMRGEEILRQMDISLGLLPEGDKTKEGDFHTPEGRYTLTTRNPDSEFFLSIQISYPDERDVREARALGVEPGGQIMIHGYPNNPRHDLDFYRVTDWTDGCIAVSNADMIDVWLMTTEETPVIIFP